MSFVKNIDTKNINSMEEQNKLIEEIKNNQLFPYTFFVGKQKMVKTASQLNYLHKLIDCFTHTMQANNFSQNTTGDWMAELKRKAHFYKSNTGIVVLDKELKLKLWRCIKNNFDEEEQKKIVACFKEQTLKSLSEASRQEISMLITNCVDMIINELPFTKDMLNQEEELKSLLQHWFVNQQQNNQFDEKTNCVMIKLESIL